MFKDTDFIIIFLHGIKLQKGQEEHQILGSISFDLLICEYKGSIMRYLVFI